jgi:exodeoxyribonuclease III
MTYNILTGGHDALGDARLGKVCDVIRSVKPDVLVLNECNGFEQHGYRTFYRLEHELGMRGVFAPSSTGFHVALFTRVGRLVETQLLDAQMHHTAIAARLDIHGEHVFIIGAHLCPFGGETRVAEIQHLLRFVGKEHVFLLGDLNAISPHDAAACRTQSWLPRRRARHQLAGGGGVLDTRAIATLEDCELIDTFRAKFGSAAPSTCLTRLRGGWEDYQVRIDYVFATRAASERVVLCERVDGPLADEASDHYPLFVDAEF